MGLLPTMSRVTRCGPRLTVGNRSDGSARSIPGATRLAATEVAPFRKSRRLLSGRDESKLSRDLNKDVLSAMASSRSGKSTKIEMRRYYSPRRVSTPCANIPLRPREKITPGCQFTATSLEPRPADGHPESIRSVRPMSALSNPLLFASAWALPPRSRHIGQLKRRANSILGVLNSATTPAQFLLAMDYWEEPRCILGRILPRLSRSCMKLPP